MPTCVRSQILDAFFVIFRPAARLLLQFGIGYRDISEVFKRAMVDVAGEVYGKNGQRASISRVATLTNLTRKEVRRLRDKVDEAPHKLDVAATSITEILSRWNTETDYLDNEGTPVVLPFEGDGVSFSALVKKCSSGMSPSEARSQMKANHAISEDKPDELRVLRRENSPRQPHDYVALALKHSVYSLLSNIAHNSSTRPEDAKWPQYLAYVQRVDNADLPRLRKASSDHLTDVARTFDDQLIAFQKRQKMVSKAEDATTVAIGCYYFEELHEHMNPVWEP